VTFTNITLQAERDPDEEGDFMAFEQLMAEATAKRERKTDTKKEEKAEKKHRFGGSHHESTPATAEKTTPSTS
jgi:hypothetical protein